MREMYVFSQNINSWIYMGDLPEPLSKSAVAVLSPVDILVIGGYGQDREKQNSVYKGTLTLKV